MFVAPLTIPDTMYPVSENTIHSFAFASCMRVKMMKDMVNGQLQWSYSGVLVESRGDVRLDVRGEMYTAW